MTKNEINYIINKTFKEMSESKIPWISNLYAAYAHEFNTFADKFANDKITYEECYRGKKLLKSQYFYKFINGKKKRKLSITWEEKIVIGHIMTPSDEITIYSSLL